MEDVIKQLKELGELLKSGAISQEEFQVLKKELIGSNKVADYSTSYSDTSQSKEYKEKNVQPEYKELPNNESSILKNNIFQTTDQFWETFHASLESPISYWRDYKSCTVSEWIDYCSNNQFSAHLDIIFDSAPLLKDEYPVVWSNGTGMILTNYRLFINLDAGLFIIPLCSLISYKMVGNEKVRIEYDANGEKQHVDVYAWLLPEYINNVKNAKQWIILSNKEQEYLQYSFYDLKSRFNLNPPKISYDYSRYDGNTKNKSKKGKHSRLRNNEKINFSLLMKGCFLSMTSFVLIIGLGYWFLSTPSSDNSDIQSDENIINDSGNIANKEDAEKFVIGEWQANSSYAKYKWRFKFNSNYIVTVDTKSKDQNVWSDWKRPHEMYWEIRVLENDDGSDGYWIYMSREENFTNGKISNVGLQIHIDADWIGNDLLYGGLRKEGVAWKVN